MIRAASGESIPVRGIGILKFIVLNLNGETVRVSVENAFAVSEVRCDIIALKALDHKGLRSVEENGGTIRLPK